MHQPVRSRLIVLRDGQKGGPTMARWSSVAQALFALVFAGATTALVGCASMGGRSDASSTRILGWRSDLGKGTVSSYAELDAGDRPAPIAHVFAIHSGPCGPEFVRCDQFEIGKKLAPSNYRHPDFTDVGAVVPAMGNHLLDLTAPEFNKQPFTRSWIFGAYDSRITFYEEMVTRAFLLSKPGTCFPIKSPKAVAVRGFYPTMSCIRHTATIGEHTISIEKFVFREASPAESSAATK